MLPPDIGFRPTVPDALRRAVSEYPDLDYLVSLEERWTFAEAEERSAHIARRLLAAGVGKGTRVGLFFTYGGEWLLLWLALSRIGALVMPFSTFYAPRELRTAMRIGDVELLFAPDRILKIDVPAFLEEAFPGLEGQRDGHLRLDDAPYLRRIHSVRPVDRPWAGDFDLMTDATADDVSDELLRRVEEQVFPSDPAVVVYTSGTTAEPKGVVHSQGTVMRQTSIMAYHQRMWAGDLQPKFLCTMPFFWVGGVLAVAGALQGGVTLLTLPKLEAGPALELIERERGTGVAGFPTFMQELRNHPDFATRDLSSARMLLDGPSDISMIGVPGDKPTHRSLSESGGSFFATDVRVIDPETGETVQRGEEGELLIRGPGAFEGYLKRERWEAFDADGWYHTGDRVYQLEDPGDVRIFFAGRYSELIKSAGANVSPKEVEAVLDEFDEVVSSFVVGLDDPERGEVVAAVVVPKDPTAWDTESMAVKARASLSSYKVPRRWIVASASEVPLLGTGKVNRKKLVELIQEGALA
jgi:acyl-CoA synthetase (AMP-forming)/AMP-acid ligase II